MFSTTQFIISFCREMPENGHFATETNYELGSKWIISFCLLWGVYSAGNPQAGMRPDFSKLVKNSYSERTLFKFPLMATQTSALFELPSEALSEKVKGFLKGRILPFGALFQKTGFGFEGSSSAKVKIPDGIFKDFGGMEKLLASCNINNCLIKLHATTEIKTFEKLSPPEKVKAFEGFVGLRIKRFVSDMQLKGYGSRLDNIPFFVEGLDLLGFPESDYPSIYQFMKRGFWKGGAPPGSFSNSFLCEEELKIEDKGGGLVWRVNEVLEFKEKGKTLFFVIPIYNSHLFDFSMSMFEIVPKEKKSILIMSDVMEFETLNKDSYKLITSSDTTQNAVLAYQKKTIEKFRE